MIRLATKPKRLDTGPRKFWSDFMDEKKAVVGMKVRHMNWPPGVYGTIAALDEKRCRLIVPFAPDDDAQSYMDQGDRAMLRNFDPVE